MTYNFKEITENLLTYYQIDDSDRQLKNYFKTYNDELKEKLNPHADKNFIYIGEKKGHLGDNVNYTPLPRYLKKKFPGKIIIIHPNRYTGHIYYGNPYPDRIEVIDGEEPWGSFTEVGWGNAVQRRAGSNRITVSETKGELYPPKEKKERILQKIRNKYPDKKLVVLHTTGKSIGSSMPKKLWKKLVSTLKDDYIIIQVGGKEDKKIRNCHFHFLKSDIIDVISLISISDFFIGPNSGFMHIAAALGIKSLILVHEIPADEIRLPAFADNFLLPKKINNHLFHLYPQNMHLHLRENENLLVPKLDDKNLQMALDGKIFHWPSAQTDLYLRHC